jgi:hypothetical protein
MIIRALNLVSAVSLSLAVMSPTSLLAQGDMGPIGIVVLEDMVREQNTPVYGYEPFRSRPSYKKRACQLHKMRSCQNAARTRKVN